MCGLEDLSCADGMIGSSADEGGTSEATSVASLVSGTVAAAAGGSAEGSMDWSVGWLPLFWLEIDRVATGASLSFTIGFLAGFVGWLSSFGFFGLAAPKKEGMLDCCLFGVSDRPRFLVTERRCGRSFGGAIVVVVVLVTAFCRGQSLSI